MQPLFATTARGLEEVLGRELDALGASAVVPGRGGVSFRGDLECLYRSCLWLRTASRVLVPLAEFVAPSAEALYEAVRKLPWHDRFRPRMTLAVEATTRDSHLTHSQFIALKVKDAIVDEIRAARGERPSIDLQSPSLRVHVRLLADRASLSLDASGRSLHERGYRVAAGAAPLKETLAAGLVALTGWKAERTLVHPMCGSGTVAIEAALAGRDVAPGLHRTRWGFAEWVEHRPALWRKVVEEARARQEAGKRRPLSIFASDGAAEAVAAASRNAEAAGVSDAIRLERIELSELRAPAGVEPGTLLVNPPYGERLETTAELYTALGDRLKHHFKGYTAYVLTGAPELRKRIGLRTSRRIPLFNGPIECRLLAYELY